MKYQKLILAVIISFILGSVITIVITSSLISEAVSLKKDGDAILLTKPSEALEKYNEAQKKWPLLKFDKELKGQIDKASKQIEKGKEKGQIIIYLKDEASDAEIQSLIKEFKSIKGVRDAKLITKEDAFNLYKERNKDEPSLLEFVTPDILPMSIEVFLEDKSVKSKISKSANDRTFVETVILIPDL